MITGTSGSELNLPGYSASCISLWPSLFTPNGEKEVSLSLEQFTDLLTQAQQQNSNLAWTEKYRDLEQLPERSWCNSALDGQNASNYRLGLLVGIAIIAPKEDVNGRFNTRQVREIHHYLSRREYPQKSQRTPRMTRRAFFEHSMAGIDYLKLSIGSDAVSTLVDRFSDNNASVVAFKVGLGIVIDADVHCAQQRQHIQDTVRHY